MKSFNHLTFVFLFVTLCAFTCEDDEVCDTLDDFQQVFDLELSSTDAVFTVDDKITITASFSTIFPSDFNEFEYDVSGQEIQYDFELFEVQANNLPVQTVGDKIELSSAQTNIFDPENEIFKSIRVPCAVDCALYMQLELKEQGYYGIVFKDGHFVSMEDCVVTTATGSKSNVQNIDILNEIGTQSISYVSSDSPVEITETNSFFFKVE